MPENIAPYVRAIGIDKTVELLLEFGGASLYFGKNPTMRSRVVALIGAEAVKAMEAGLGSFGERVPLANRWIANYLAAQSVPTQEIARRLRTTNVTVRNYLRGRSAPGRLNAPKQLNLDI
ncbi:MAG TPA: hypothetical protein PLK13_11765 [Xanthobacteraceae bacterium]|nr:hypothetical protein [Xanthobacteraceae bacterium]HQS45938.1 hypothetical protein [Xanthobacteraceae bacterium]